MEIMKKMDDAMSKRKTDKAVYDLENKKGMLQAAVAKEIAYVKKQINDEYSKIGESSYELFLDGNLSNESLTVHFERVTEYLKEIGEKEGKINEIAKRYDEEISLLRQLITSTVSASMTTANKDAGLDACPKCKKPYSKGIDVFCVNCGQNLSSC